jgi:hypothetical protein
MGNVSTIELILITICVVVIVGFIVRTVKRILNIK